MLLKRTLVVVVFLSILETINCEEVEKVHISSNSILTNINSPETSQTEITEPVWHWLPYRRTDYQLHVDGRAVKVHEECVEQPSSIHDFPKDLFTQQQRQQGAVILHIVGAIYFFTLLAVVLNDYFIPSVECICEDLKISKDVAAATFMATATSTPELFTNVISVFIAESDMGLGTIIGSMMFNTLGVAALAALSAPKPVQLDWWPITRDSILYSINIALLVSFAWDGRIYWYESMTLVIMCVVYFIIMFQNQRIMGFVKSHVEGKWNCCKKNITEVAKSNNNTPIEEFAKGEKNLELPVEKEPKIRKSLWTMPSHSGAKQFWYFYTWPIKFILTMTIPSPKTYRKLYPLTFFLCIIWIGVNSYMIFWMIAIVGYTFMIPETIMGLTFLAAGGCMGEAISGVLCARRGDGGMGVSNSLGANSLAILVSLGLPWFIRSMFDGGSKTAAFIKINSVGIEFTILSLLLTVVALYLIVSIASYRLKKAVGFYLFFTYLIFVTFAILVEMDILFPSGNYC